MEAPTNMGRKRPTCKGLGHAFGLRGWYCRPCGLGCGNGMWGGGRGCGWSGSGLCWDWRAGLNRDWLCGLGGLWSLTHTALEAGQYLLNEFGAGGRKGSVRRRGRLRGLGKWRVMSGE